MLASVRESYQQFVRWFRQDTVLGWLTRAVAVSAVFAGIGLLFGHHSLRYDVVAGAIIGVVLVSALEIEEQLRDSLVLRWLVLMFTMGFGLAGLQLLTEQYSPFEYLISGVRFGVVVGTINVVLEEFLDDS